MISQVNRLRLDRELLLSVDGKQGRLVKLLDQYQSLNSRLSGFAQQPHQYADLADRRGQLDGDIDRARERRAQIANELQGRRFMARVYPVWKQVRQTKRELAAMPAVAGASTRWNTATRRDRP